jgi:spore coat polysaccharide biosynthesis predicted glycosyltransferase SpsG
MWVFHFRIDSDTIDICPEKVQGYGHGVRCAALMKKVQELYGIHCKTIINESKQAKDFVIKNNLEFVFESNVNKFLEENAHNIERIIFDINYFSLDELKQYKKIAPVFCLAPRGEAKFYADVSFKDVFFYDLEIPDSCKTLFFEGPKYCVIRDEILNLRKVNEKEIGKMRICISMGGVDHFNMTKHVLIALNESYNNYEINVCVGDGYQYLPELMKIPLVHKNRVNVYIGGEHLAEQLSRSQLAILSSGVVAYEAAFLGIPSINIGHSQFHLMRQAEIEKLGFSFSGGMYNDIPRKKMYSIVNGILNGKNKWEGMHRQCLKWVDGNGMNRILEVIRKYS